MTVGHGGDIIAIAFFAIVIGIILLAIQLIVAGIYNIIFQTGLFIPYYYFLKKKVVKDRFTQVSSYILHIFLSTLFFYPAMYLLWATYLKEDIFKIGIISQVLLISAVASVLLGTLSLAITELVWKLTSGFTNNRPTIRLIITGLASLFITSFLFIPALGIIYSIIIVLNIQIPKENFVPILAGSSLLLSLFVSGIIAKKTVFNKWLAPELATPKIE